MATYTHGHHETVLRSHSTRTIANSAEYLRPHLVSGARLLDVGAGPGSITVDFAGVVGHVTATEIDENALSLSHALATSRGLTNLDFRVEDVHSLSFADDSFDIVHAHQVLQHVGDPVQALREMRRVTVPGGVVAARDADYAGFAWFPMLPELDTWLDLYRRAARANGGEPDAGRRLLAWARAAGFDDVTATGSAWTYATPEDRAWWGGMWADRILESALARQLVDGGMATGADLRAISEAWTRWADDGDGWYLVPHGEIIARA
ncbi:class I SAM-dependent methyltransferase [Microbacterium foliorum]|uniref:Demethylrebeccamycin-D-glucose O-methyltransferase n=1 Tax=Microbacterium foliorum TaxID=104336 RepID=A0A0F0KDT9_9MICO|nr:class I SAM-dependent methyltransferase [Microbacterium foliorum]AXL11369.1 class I SAM-dependent methyltransferase [Microbacterium foliorum]KJL19077.1 Demethylrebeccamycin-D-glucose O-methyltransferase [Microbacterium foliorum]